LLKTVLTKEEYLDLTLLTANIKKLPLTINTTASVDEAISTVGGIALTEIDANFQLKNLPHHFCIGEMLDYDAPTGGYLLQSCFSMGVYVANTLNKEL
jgi:predicted flavoprotein YhiN